MSNDSSRLERWCTTAVCGNREKARRRYERTR
ncbi:CGNR zinc finger domain-containing protein [Streptomyces fimicarius]